MKSVKNLNQNRKKIEYCIIFVVVVVSEIEINICVHSENKNLNLSTKKTTKQNDKLLIIFEKIKNVIIVMEYTTHKITKFNINRHVSGKFPISQNNHSFITGDFERKVFVFVFLFDCLWEKKVNFISFFF